MISFMILTPDTRITVVTYRTRVGAITTEGLYNKEYILQGVINQDGCTISIPGEIHHLRPCQSSGWSSAIYPPPHAHFSPAHAAASLYGSFHSSSSDSDFANSTHLAWLSFFSKFQRLLWVNLTTAAQARTCLHPLGGRAGSRFFILCIYSRDYFLLPGATSLSSAEIVPLRGRHSRPSTSRPPGRKSFRARHIQCASGSVHIGHAWRDITLSGDQLDMVQ